MFIIDPIIRRAFTGPLVLWFYVFLGSKRDSKGRFSRKMTGTPKQQAVRAKDRRRKEMAQKLAIFNKFAKFLINDDDFEFFAMFKSKGETHFAGTLVFSNVQRQSEHY